MTVAQPDVHSLRLRPLNIALHGMGYPGIVGFLPADSAASAQLRSLGLPSPANHWGAADRELSRVAALGKQVQRAPLCLVGTCALSSLRVNAHSSRRLGEPIGGGMATRRQAKLDRRARIEEMRAKERTRKRRVRLAWLGGGGVAIVAVIAVIVAVTVFGGSSSSSSGSTSSEVIPPGVTGATTTQPSATTVANTTGISGVVAYDTAGWPASSHNGPASKDSGTTTSPDPSRTRSPRQSAVTTTRCG